MNKLSISDHALLFIEYWIDIERNEIVLAGDLFDFFNGEISLVRANTVLRELYKDELLHRKLQKKRREYEQPTKLPYHIHAIKDCMYGCLCYIDSKKEQKFAYERIKKFIDEFSQRNLRIYRKKIKKKKKPGPPGYSYHLSKKGIKRCEMLRGKGYTFLKSELMKEMK